MRNPVVDDGSKGKGAARKAEEKSVGGKGRCGMKRGGMLLCFAMFLNAEAARAQQSSSPKGSGGGEQAAGESAGQKSAARAERHGSGIVADNLDRVAATAEQILEALNRDPGLMVDLKPPR